MTASITLSLNGQPRDFAAGTTIDDMVQQVGANLQHIAVECNHVIVPRSQFAKTPLHNGDTIELVEFVGGG